MGPTKRSCFLFYFCGRGVWYGEYIYIYIYIYIYRERERVQERRSVQAERERERERERTRGSERDEDREWAEKTRGRRSSAMRSMQAAEKKVRRGMRIRAILPRGPTP